MHHEALRAALTAKDDVAARALLAESGLSAEAALLSATTLESALWHARWDVAWTLLEAGAERSEDAFRHAVQRGAPVELARRVHVPGRRYDEIPVAGYAAAHGRFDLAAHLVSQGEAVDEVTTARLVGAGDEAMLSLALSAGVPSRAALEVLVRRGDVAALERCRAAWRVEASSLEWVLPRSVEMIRHLLQLGVPLPSRGVARGLALECCAEPDGLERLAVLSEAFDLDEVDELHLLIKRIDFLTHPARRAHRAEAHHDPILARLIERVPIDGADRVEWVASLPRGPLESPTAPPLLWIGPGRPAAVPLLVHAIVLGTPAVVQALIERGARTEGVLEQPLETSPSLRGERLVNAGDTPRDVAKTRLKLEKKGLAAARKATYVQQAELDVRAARIAELEAIGRSLSPEAARRRERGGA